MARSLTERRLRAEKRAQQREQRRERRKGRMSRLARVLVCVCVAVCVGLPAVFVNNLIGYAALISVGAIIAISALYLHLIKKRLEVREPSLVSTCVRGESLPFAITLANASPLVMLRIEPTFYVSDLFGGEDALTTTTVSLAPHETYDFDFGIRFDHIGTYTAGLRQVVIHDMLGLFSVTYENSSRHIVEVTPRVFDVSALRYDFELLKEQPEARKPMTMDGSDYTCVREYVIGDPMKSIHWKLSARSDVYFTKVFETLGSPGIEAILDFRSPAYSAEDMMSVFDGVVESALSVGAYAHKVGMEFDLVYKNKDGADVRISSKQNTYTTASFMDSLPTISATKHEDEALELLRHESNSAYAQRNIVMCTATVNDKLISALVSAKQRQRNPLLVAIVPPSMGLEERAAYVKPLRQLDAAKISYMVICAADQLGEVSSR